MQTDPPSEQASQPEPEYPPPQQPEQPQPPYPLPPQYQQLQPPYPLDQPEQPQPPYPLPPQYQQPQYPPLPGQYPPGNPAPRELASPLQRLFARILDSIILAIVGVVVAELFLVVNDDSIVLYIFFFMCGVFYEVGMVATRGATLGKMVINLKVIDAETGAIPEWRESFLRWFVLNGIAAILSFFSPTIATLGVLVGILVALSILWDPRKQGWHDMAAKTYVVRA